MIASAVLAHFDEQMRRNARPDTADAVLERTDRVVRQSVPGDGWNGVLWSSLSERDADEEIRAQIAHFAALGREFEWKHYAHDAPADLPARLAAAGLVAEEPEAMMALEVAAFAGEVAPPEGITLVEVGDEAGVELMMRAHEAAFGHVSPQVRHQLVTRLAHDPDSLAAVVAMDGREPVCAARLEMPDGVDFAGLWGGGTVERWRGRGIYRSVLAWRVRAAAARGYRYVYVDASADSRPILSRLGFTHLTTTTPFVYAP
ncbi:GNAT family N-acetyltransferase [Nonomuraea sp. NBC_01738]|uniref:GNAT family N-acetyltransferase n=1 Tax=Nonomuraea sp. NBC_01738 TaxID=2976003 RepID=UPI002E158891|nr:GNAT family N-acetyltransferase [Nonomuraea sp. NBC_01738]